MELQLYRQYTTGLFRIFRHSGRTGAKWRPVFVTHDEGQAHKKYEALYKKWRQGGLRLIDPEGQVIQSAFAEPMRWGRVEGDRKRFF